MTDLVPASDGREEQKTESLGERLERFPPHLRELVKKTTESNERIKRMSTVVGPLGRLFGVSTSSS